MVERLTMSSHPLDGAAMDAHPHGDYVLYSDFAELEAENERLRTLVMAQSRAIHSPEALSRTGAVKVPSEELRRYIDRCREMSNDGEYSWWSRLAEILAALETDHIADAGKMIEPTDTKQPPEYHDAAEAIPASTKTEGQQPVAVIEFARGKTGNENEMPRVVSCNWLPDGHYEVFTSPTEQAVTDAGKGLLRIVEEIDGAMEHGTWRDEKGMRLKDTPEWVAFYNAIKAAMEAGR